MSAESWLQALGLVENPFAEGALSNFYFVGGQRRFLLQQAVHGLYIARSIVLVSGERGAGKSHLLNALRGELDGLADCCPVSASVLMDGVAVRRELTEFYRLPPESALENEALVMALARQTPLDVEALPVALLIDDAHELAVQTLMELQQLVELGRGRVRLLLAGEPTLVAAWQQLPVAAAELLELQPLDLQESADYLQTRLQAAGFRGVLPLSSEQMRRLHRATAGCIGRLNEQAPAALGTPDETVTVTPTTEMMRRLPWRRIAAGAVVIALIGVVIALTGGESDSDGAGSRGGERAVIALKLPSADPADDFEASQEGGRAPEAPENNGRPVMPMPAVQHSAPGGEREPAPVRAKASGTDAAESPPVTVAPLPAPAPKPAEPPKPAKAAAESTTAYRFDERKLLGLATDHYVLQLMGVGSASALQRFAKQNAASVPVLMFEARRSGKPWFVLVAGPYSDRDRAQAAVAKLPASLRTAKPWPRTAASVQADIRTAHGGH